MCLHAGIFLYSFELNSFKESQEIKYLQTHCENVAWNVVPLFYFLLCLYWYTGTITICYYSKTIYDIVYSMKICVEEYYVS